MNVKRRFLFLFVSVSDRRLHDSPSMPVCHGHMHHLIALRRCPCCTLDDVSGFPVNVRPFLLPVSDCCICRFVQYSTSRLSGIKCQSVDPTEAVYNILLLGYESISLSEIDIGLLQLEVRIVCVTMPSPCIASIRHCRLQLPQGSTALISC